MKTMTNPVRRQIEEMEPRRYARAAKRAAEAAESSALKEGIALSPRIRHLLDSTEDQLVEEQRKRLVAHHEPDPPRGRSGGSGLGTSVDPIPDTEMETSESRKELPPVSSTNWDWAATLPLVALASGLPGDAYSAAKAALRTKLGGDVVSSALSTYSHADADQLASAFLEVAVGRPSRQSLQLEKSESIMSVDGAWQIIWRDGGDLLVIVKDEEPWLTPVDDDDEVTVDPATGTIVIQGARPRSPSIWQRDLRDAEHKYSRRREANHIQIIHISTHDRISAPAVIGLPTWERSIGGRGWAHHGIDVEKNEAQRALSNVDFV